ncbi:D-alanyl-D-alanine carboxypeptidase family protein, partial [Phytohabitans maris]|uniref:D-alanyl-D-alanine carboxypeptidase family protein n=1 Tax=Phytohabitans maris TaxID=3071409 RepID=UPI003D17E284
MNGRVLVAALVSSMLSAVPVVVSGSPVSAAPGGAHSGPAAAARLAAPVVPCPTEKLSPPPQRPPKPKPPALDPANARVGGDALATTGLAIPAGAAAPPKLTASTWLVADLDTGQVLGGCDPHGYETPASVQKVLLAATMIPKLDPKQVVQVTREDLNIERGSSAVGLLEGGKYPIETLWYGLLFDSGNDAANVLARVGGGDKGRAGGVAAMNAQARHLGALQTHAVTPSGLDGAGQFTSAYDLVLIARAAFALPDFRKYVATKTAKIPPQPPRDTRGFQIQNDNALLENYPGALGGKSGFTTLARHSFVGAAKRGDRTLVAAVLGAEARPIRASEQTAKLLDWGFALPADASVGRLVEPGELDPKPTPPADRAAAAEGAAARPADGIPGSSPAAVIGLTVAVVAVVLVMLVAATRRRAAVRARRAALAERRAAPDRARRPDPPPA